jgi:cyclohexadieny/prephenate dehydrogenase
MTNTASQPLFETVAFIGMGLIGSSMTRRIKRDGLANDP